MKENKYTETEQIIKSTLHDALSQGEDWNTPPPSVFENAMAVVNKEEKDRGLFFWLFLPIFLISILVIAQPKDVSEQRKLGFERVTVPPRSKPTNTSSEKNEIPQQHQKMAPTQPVQKSTLSPASTKPQPEINSYSTQHAAQLKVISSVGITNPTATNLNQTRFSVSFVPTSQRKPQKIACLELHLNLPEFANEKAEDPDKNHYPSKFTLYGLAGNNFSSLRMKSSKALPFDLTNYDKFYSGYQLGLGITQHIHPKFRLGLSLKYQRISNRSLFSNVFNYKKNDEFIDAFGNLRYVSDLHINSPMEEVDKEIQMALGNQTINDQDILLNVTHISNVFRTLGLGLDLEFLLWNKKHTRLFLRSGLSADYMLSLKQKLNTEVYYNGQMLYQDKETDWTSFNPSRFYLTSSLGTRIEQNLGQKHVLGLNLSYQASLSPIKQFNAPIAAETRLTQFNAALTLGIKL